MSMAPTHDSEAPEAVVTVAAKYQRAQAKIGLCETLDRKIISATKNGLLECEQVYGLVQESLLREIVPLYEAKGFQTDIIVGWNELNLIKLSLTWK